MLKANKEKWDHGKVFKTSFKGVSWRICSVWWSPCGPEGRAAPTDTGSKFWQRKHGSVKWIWLRKEEGKRREENWRQSANSHGREEQKSRRNEFPCPPKMSLFCPKPDKELMWEPKEFYHSKSPEFPVKLPVHASSIFFRFREPRHQAVLVELQDFTVTPMLIIWVASQVWRQIHPKKERHKKVPWENKQIQEETASFYWYWSLKLISPPFCKM